MYIQYNVEDCGRYGVLGIGFQVVRVAAREPIDSTTGDAISSGGHQRVCYAIGATCSPRRAPQAQGPFRPLQPLVGIYRQSMQHSALVLAKSHLGLPYPDKWLAVNSGGGLGRTGLGPLSL